MAPPTTAFASAQQQAIKPPIWGVVWLLHAAVEFPLAFVGLFINSAVQFEGMNNAVSVVVKLYSALSLSLSVACLLLYTIPDYLPGKRAVAILLLFYHGIASSIFFNAEPFTGVVLSESFTFKGAALTPEKVAGVAHGILALMVTAWWQSTLPQVKAASGSVPAAGGAAKKRR